ncbi:MAG TPA: hypothetical protein VI894_00605 [Candidatus Nanoarchaeia archaeon]|nr:hypothetical protein [Candidatus Nanoarchaeia archaeon]
MANLKQIAITAGIAVIFALLIGLSVDYFYPEPKYESYCKSEIYPKPYPVREAPANLCSYDFGPAYDNCTAGGGYAKFDYNASGCQMYKSCDFCNKQYQKSQDIYNRDIYFIITPIALIAIIAGVFWPVEFIGTGFMFGGILLLFYGTARSFAFESKLLRIIGLFIDLVVLIWIAYKKLIEKSSESRKKKKSKKK